MPDYSSPAVTYDDVWEALAHVCSRWGCEVECRLWPPRRGAGGAYLPARAAVTAAWTPPSPTRPVTRFCQIGGARGARTAPAALLRALYELEDALEERERSRAEQTAF